MRRGLASIGIGLFLLVGAVTWLSRVRASEPADRLLAPTGLPRPVAAATQVPSSLEEPARTAVLDEVLEKPDEPGVPGDPPEPAVLDVLVWDPYWSKSIEGALVSVYPLGKSEKHGLRRSRPLVPPFTTDVTGSVSISVRAGMDHTLRAANVFGNPGEAETDVVELTPGEHRSVRIALDTGYRERFGGYVLDAANGAPVARAIVRVHDRLARPGELGRDLGRSAYLELEVGPNGDFEFFYDKPVYASARAPGYVESFFRVSPALATGGPFAIHLPEAASIEATVLDASGQPVRRAEVRVEASLMTVLIGPDTDRMRIPNASRWKELTDAEGRCRIDGLPAGAALEVTLSHGGTPVDLEIDDLVLRAGRTRALELVIGG